MKIKMLEIRDVATFIQAAAFHCQSPHPREAYLLSKAGFGRDSDLIQMVMFHGGRTAYDPYDWSSARTMRVAHDWVQKNWDDIESGDVIDVEYILGETDNKKISEQYE